MNEENLNLNEIMKVETMPKIVQQLRIVSDEVDNAINNALSLQCTEENKQEVKNERAKLNKIKTALENKRKEIKEKIEQPYKEFEKIYKDLIQDKLVNADVVLKNKISDIETKQKQERENEIKAFAEEQIKSNNLEGIISYEKMNIVVGLSKSIKSLKDECLEIINRINNEVELINMEEYKDEIMIEYIKNNNFVLSKKEVIERHNKLDELKKIEESKIVEETVEESDEVVEEQVEEKVEEQVEKTVEVVETPVEETVVSEEDKYLKLAEEILGTVDSYCNLDSLGEIAYGEEKTYYEQLKEGIAGIIKNFVLENVK